MNESSVWLLRSKCLDNDKNLYKLHFFKFFDPQDSAARNKIDTSLLKQFNTSESYPIETLIRSLMLFFAENWVLKSKKLNINQFFSHYLNLDITERYNGADSIWEKCAFFAFGYLRYRKCSTRKLEKFVGLVIFITKL